MGKKEIPVSKKFSAPPSPVLGMSKTMDQGQQQEDGILRGTHMEDANQFNKHSVFHAKEFVIYYSHNFFINESLCIVCQLILVLIVLPLFKGLK